MKVKVLKKFKDKYSGEIYKPKPGTGTVIEVTKERFEEICKTDSSLIEAVEEKAEESTEETAEEKAEEKKPARKTKAK